MFSIVVFIPNQWHSPSFKHRQASTNSIAKALGDEGIMIVVEPEQFFLTLLYQNLKKRRHRYCKYRIIREEGTNIYIFTPLTLFPRCLIRLNWIRALNLSLIRKGLNRVLKKVVPNSTRVSWFYRPDMVEWADQIGEKLLIYECYDKHDHNLKALSKPGMKDRLQHQENQLIARADIIFTTSPMLFENISQLHPNVYLFPNAVDVEFFSRAQRNDTMISEYMLKLKHPIIGYLGSLNRFFDVGIMLSMAKKRPNWSVLIVGPENDPSFCSSKPYKDFKSLENVQSISWLDEQIPNYFKEVDVCILPWDTNYNFVRFSSPNKLFQYAAMGKPVVSTDIPYCRGYPDLVEIANTPEEITEKIEKALAEEGPEKINERLRLAQENSWDKRSKAMASVIRKRILGKMANSSVDETDLNLFVKKRS